MGVCSGGRCDCLLFGAPVVDCGCCACGGCASCVGCAGGGANWGCGVGDCCAGVAVGCSCAREGVCSCRASSCVCWRLIRSGVVTCEVRLNGIRPGPAMLFEVKYAILRIVVGAIERRCEMKINNSSNDIHSHNVSITIHFAQSNTPQPQYTMRFTSMQA